MTEVPARVTVEPNCTHVLLQFAENGPEPFELELRLEPKDALFVAYRLQKAAHEILEDKS